jgi:ribonuclease HI
MTARHQGPKRGSMVYAKEDNVRSPPRSEYTPLDVLNAIESPCRTEYDENELKEIVVVPNPIENECEQQPEVAIPSERKKESKKEHTLQEAWQDVLQEYGTKVKVSNQSPAWVVNWNSEGPFMNRIAKVHCDDRVRAFKSMMGGGRVTCDSMKSTPINIIWDTGAARTSISGRVWRKIRQPDQTLLVTNCQLRNASGGLMKVLGVTKVEALFGNRRLPFIAIVIDDLTVDMIAGVDFLDSTQAVIDCANHVVHIPGIRPIKVSIEDQEPEANVLALRSEIELKPLSNTMIKLPISLPNGTTVGIEPTCSNQRHIQVARTVATVKDGACICQITNTGHSLQRLAAGLQLGIAYECKVQPSQFDNDVAVEKQTRKWDDWKKELSRQLKEPKSKILAMNGRDDQAAIIDAQLKHLNDRERNQMKAVIRRYSQLFVTGQTKMPTEAQDAIAHIPGGDDRPQARPPYRYPNWKRKIINEQTKGMVEQGIIEESLSPWAAPVVLVEKPGQPGKWRLCIDYRAMNKVVEHLVWPIPRIDESIDLLRKAKYFSCLDLAWGFWALPLDAESKVKTGFSTQDGHFHWCRMPMGWQGAPASFQKAMDLLLVGIKGIYALCYIDDLLIYSETFEEHLMHLEEVCQRLKSANRSVRLEKAQWAQDKVKFLGFSVGRGQVEPIDSKTAAIQRLAPPTDVSTLRSFLGATGAYRRFIAGYAQIVKPLYALIRKGIDFKSEWNKDQQYVNAFERIKAALQTAPVLQLPDMNAPFAVCIESNSECVGGTLIQKDANSRWKPVQFMSRALTTTERKLSVTEWELLALDYALQKSKHLFGFNEITVFSKEVDLAWACDPMNLFGKMRTTSLRINQFNLKFEKSKGVLERMGYLFSYNDPQGPLRAATEKRRVEHAQKSTVKLIEFDNQRLVGKSHWILCFDGGFRQGSNRGAYGWALWHVKDSEWKVVAAGSDYCDDATTVNVEEFKGLATGLQYARSVVGTDSVHVFGDSKLVIGIMQGVIQCRSEHLLKWYEKIKKIASTNDMWWHVRREFNKVADHMVNIAMDRSNSFLWEKAEPELKQLKQLDTLQGWVNEKGKAKVIAMVRPKFVCRPRPGDEPATATATVESTNDGKGPAWAIKEASRIKIQHAQYNTIWMRNIIKFLEEAQVPEDEQERNKLKQQCQMFEMYDGLLWQVGWIVDSTGKKMQQWKLAMPASLRDDCIREMHDTNLAGHLRGEKLLTKLRERYFWPNMARDVNHYENSCEICNGGKMQAWRRVAPLQASQQQMTIPFETVAVDYIVDLPKTARGNKHLLVFICTNSRWPEVVAVPDLTSATFVRAFMEIIVTRHGCPRHLVSDRGGQFVGKLATAVYKHLRVMKNTTTSYHPQANGLCERFNQTLISGLRALINDHQNNWDEVLDSFLFAYRTSIHAVTKCTPFELVYGRSARVPYDIMLRHFDEQQLATAPREYLRQVMTHLDETRARVRALNEEAMGKNKRIFDSRHKTAIEANKTFEVNDQVWVYDPVVPKGRKKKLSNLWRGPFAIKRVISPVTYELDLPAGSKAHPVIHANRLAPYRDRAQRPTLPREDTDFEPLEPTFLPTDDDEYVDSTEDKIIRIVDDRIRADASGQSYREYFVETRNDQCPSAGFQWIDEKHLIAGGLMWQYHESQRIKSRKQLLDPRLHGRDQNVALLSRARTNAPYGMSPVKIPDGAVWRTLE